MLFTIENMWVDDFVHCCWPWLMKWEQSTISTQPKPWSPYFQGQTQPPTKDQTIGLLTNVIEASVTLYRICSIRRCGYYLFHRAILCGFYSRAAFIKLSVLSKLFCNCKGLRKASFIRRVAMQLDQPPLCYKAVYLNSTSNPFPHFLPVISHDDCPPCLKKCWTSLDSMRSCTYHVLIWYCHSSPRFVHVRMCYSNISHG